MEQDRQSKVGFLFVKSTSVSIRSSIFVLFHVLVLNYEHSRLSAISDPPHYDRALWLLAPSGKVFDFGGMQSHLNFYEYGKKRGTLIREAHAKAHPYSQPEFYPCSKSDAYLDALKLIEGDLLNCGDPKCAFCELRGCLPATSESLTRVRLLAEEGQVCISFSELTLR